MSKATPCDLVATLPLFEWANTQNLEVEDPDEQIEMIQPDPRITRICLKCDKRFKGTRIERICGGCKRHEDWKCGLRDDSVYF